MNYEGLAVGLVLGQMRDSRKADRRPSGKSPAVAHFGPIHIPSRLKQLWDEIDPVPLKAATTAGLGGGWAATEYRRGSQRRRISA